MLPGAEKVTGGGGSETRGVLEMVRARGRGFKAKCFLCSLDFKALHCFKTDRNVEPWATEQARLS